MDEFEVILSLDAGQAQVELQGLIDNDRWGLIIVMGDAMEELWEFYLSKADSNFNIAVVWARRPTHVKPVLDQLDGETVKYGGPNVTRLVGANRIDNIVVAYDEETAFKRSKRTRAALLVAGDGS